MRHPAACVVGGLLFVALGCEPDVAQPSRPNLPAATGPQVAADAGPEGGMLPTDFQEVEFTESERSRDPFRSYADFFVAEAEGQIKSQREVVLDKYSVDELKLTGIVTRVIPHRAMLVDPTGKGWVVKRGQFVGKPEVVQAEGMTGTAYEINWRVDRIRDGDIVLIREDPQHPDVPTATRVIPLRPEGTVVATD